MTRLMIRLLPLALSMAVAACARTLPPAPVELHGGEFFGRPGATAVAGAGEAGVVRQGESVYAFARRNRIPARAIIEANSLSPPYQVEPGRRLIVPQVRAHEVQSGDSLIALAKQYGVSRDSLASANGLEPPYVIRTGQILLIPGTTPGGGEVPAATTAVAAAAPVERAPAPATAAAPPAGQPTVVASAGAGRAISGIDQSTLPPPPGAAASTAPLGAAVAPPRTPAEGGKTRAAREAAPAPAQVPAAEAPPTAVAAPPAAPAPAPAPARPEEPAAAAEPPATIGDQARLEAPEAREAVTTPPPPRAGRVFYWPLKGTILSDFGTKPGGLHNDGINISARRGTPVRAAENGVVVYAGNELRGFGNLLLIRHAGGWMTAYGHADELLVGRGDQVKRGQIIARVGSTGNVAAPQLHFEIRRGSRAVNPIDFLDQNRRIRVADGA